MIKEKDKKYPDLEIDVCECCKRSLGGVKTFEGFMAKMLVECVKISKKEKINIKGDVSFQKDLVFSRDLENKGQYTRVGDLKLWGLLEQRPEWNHYGIYKLTPLAFDFINEKIDISAAVYSYNGNVVQASKDRITFREAIGKDYFTVEEWLDDWRNRTCVEQKDLFQ